MKLLTQSVLPVLLSQPMTRAEISKALGRPVHAWQVTGMLKEGVLTKRSVFKTGKRGRPAYVLGLSDKGRKRAKRLVAAAA